MGRKYVKLYSDQMTPNLYPHQGLLSNTSEIDAECIDDAKFPLATQAEFTHAVLEPGQMLYIPAGHWHYIRSLDISFSVSFWFQ